MEPWFAILLPFLLPLARISGMFAVMPIFGSPTVPRYVRAGLILMLTAFFAFARPVGIPPGSLHWLAASVLLVREIVVGLAIGFAARLIYLAVQQGGVIAAQQMGFMDAGAIDPVSGIESQPIATLLETAFALLFLAAGGHRLLLAIAYESFRLFPVSEAPDIGALTAGVVRAGSAMLTFALKLAAPVLAGFLIMAVLLCILARVLPEMNILLASFPLRVGMGLFIAAAIMPALDAFTATLARWMKRFLLG